MVRLAEGGVERHHQGKARHQSKVIRHKAINSSANAWQ